MEDNRFYISNGNIVDYSEEEPKEMSQQEIVDELNRMQNTNDFFIGENQDLNWQVECLEEQLAKTEKALELAVADKCKFENEWLSMVVGMPNGKLLVPKKEQWYLEQAEKELRDE